MEGALLEGEFQAVRIQVAERLRGHLADLFFPGERNRARKAGEVASPLDDPWIISLGENDRRPVLRQGQDLSVKRAFNVVHAFPEGDGLKPATQAALQGRHYTAFQPGICHIPLWVV